MTERQQARTEFRQQNRGCPLQYPEDMRDQHFKDCLPATVNWALSAGEEVDNDVKALMLPPSRDMKSY
jgi:hypothetical protein